MNANHTQIRRSEHMLRRFDLHSNGIDPDMYEESGIQTVLSNAIEIDVYSDDESEDEQEMGIAVSENNQINNEHLPNVVHANAEIEEKILLNGILDANQQSTDSHNDVTVLRNNNLDIHQDISQSAIIRSVSSNESALSQSSLHSGKTEKKIKGKITIVDGLVG
jgi:hypothetical protein